MSTDASAPKREPVDAQRLRELCERAFERHWQMSGNGAVFEFLFAARTALPACLDLIEDLRALLQRASSRLYVHQGATTKQLVSEIDAALRGEPKEGM
jgi:hypothetical protein